MIAKSGVLLALAASATALPAVKRQSVPVREALFEGIIPTKDLVWYPCNETQSTYYECALLSVPLDYQDPSNKLEAVVPIVKYPTNATGSDYKGSILMNPGGPGYLGTETLYLPQIARGIAENVTGPGYDIIGFDIRGTGYSIPFASCNQTVADEFDPRRQNATEGKYDLYKRDRDDMYEGSIPPGADETETEFGFFLPRESPNFAATILQGAEALDASCTPLISGDNQAGPHMNTIVIASDMLTIAKAIARSRGENEDAALVNFLGVSYGTVMGQVFATEYPDKVGRFILDGVVNMERWQSRTEYGSVRNSAAGFYEFFQRCSAAGPEVCAFATGSSPQDTIDRFNRMMSRFNVTKYVLEGAPFAADVELVLSTMKGRILDALYGAIQTFPNLALTFAALDEATNGPIDQWNFTKISTNVLAIPLHPSPPPPPEGFARPPRTDQINSLFQVFCGDAAPIYNVTVDPGEQEAYFKASPFGGPSRLFWRLMCTRYSIRPKWEWHEKVGGNTKTPILFIGQNLDPITPFEDAIDAATRFTGAEALIVDVIAHGILDSENRCAYRHAQAYFQEGKLPGADNRCPEERRPFDS